MENKKQQIYLCVLLGLVILLMFNMEFTPTPVVIGLMIIGIAVYLLRAKGERKREEVPLAIAVSQAPIGMIEIDEEGNIQWANSLAKEIFPGKLWDGISIMEIDSAIKHDTIVTRNDRKYHVTKQQNIFFFTEIQEPKEVSYQDQSIVIAFIHLDNYDEIATSLTDQERFKLSSTVTSILNDWAMEERILIKKVSSDHFLAILDTRILAVLEARKFALLDNVRERTKEINVSLTLSIGIGIGEVSLPELAELAQSGLDLALGRGGDQVAIKDSVGKVTFYGGKTNPVEKRTRVRARVISHALQDVIVDSKQVFIMGHKAPDMDSIGAAIGILKMVRMSNRKGYVVLDNDLNDGVWQLIAELKKDEKIARSIISKEEALELVEDKSILVVVDTHKPSMVTAVELLSEVDKVVVIDHHRKGEDFIKNPLLIYMEPYASSASELVTELLEYLRTPFKLTKIEATALLAGIVVDTKSFTLRTGSRTFDAASFLRSKGADTVFVQKLLREDMDNYLIRASIVEQAYFYRKGIVIATSEKEITQLMIAQTVDTLLAMSDTIATFVIAKKPGNLIGISARSLGEVNVQVIIEKLGGGGHLTNAAAQLTDTTVKEVEALLQKIIDEKQL